MDLSMSIFIVEDEPVYLEFLRIQLLEMGFNTIEVYETGQGCIDDLYKMPDLIFLDYNLEDMTGIDVLKQIMAFNPNINVIFLSSQRDIDIAVNTLKYGAYDYVTKDDHSVERITYLLEKISNLNSAIQKSKKVKQRKLLLVSLLLAIGIITGIVGHIILERL